MKDSFARKFKPKRNSCKNLKKVEKISPTYVFNKKKY